MRRKRVPRADSGLPDGHKTDFREGPRGEAPTTMRSSPQDQPAAPTAGAPPSVAIVTGPIQRSRVAAARHGPTSSEPETQAAAPKPPTYRASTGASAQSWKLRSKYCPASGWTAR